MGAQQMEKGSRNGVSRMWVPSRQWPGRDTLWCDVFGADSVPALLRGKRGGTGKDGRASLSRTRRGLGLLAGFHSAPPAHPELTRTPATSPGLGAGAKGVGHTVAPVSVFRFAFTTEHRQACLRFLSAGTTGYPTLMGLLWDAKGGDLGPVGACLGTVTNSILDIPHLFYIYPSEKTFTTLKQHISLSLQLSREESNDMGKSFLNS